MNDARRGIPDAPPRRPVTPSLTEVINMKYALLVTLAALVAMSSSATDCHRNKYIVGITGDIGAKGKTGIYVADTVHGLPNPTPPLLMLLLLLWCASAAFFANTA